MSGVSPSDDDLARAASEARSENPTLGIVKVLALVKERHPQWTVSEKRLRKFLSPVSAGTQGKTHELKAQTGLDQSIDTTKLAPKVDVRLWEGVKGKGLVARAEILQGEVLWQEEPWIVTADSNLHPYIRNGEMCAQCLTLFPQPNPPLSASCGECSTVRFCNRLCLARSKTSGAHPDLLCPGRNPNAIPLLQFVTSSAARHFDAVARIIAMWRGARESGDAETVRNIEQRTWQSMARVNIEEKERAKEDWDVVGSSRIKHWQHAHGLLLAALNPATSQPEYAPFSKALRRLARNRKALTEDEVQQWFSFDSFLQLLGMASINQEDSGGLYALHSHLNHSCQPNVQVRNMPKSFTAPTSLPCSLPPPNPRGIRGTNKLTMIARDTISPGQELLISYVNPDMPVTDRRETLRAEYGFWCRCSRCQSELR